MTTEDLPTQTTDAGIPVESDEYSLTVGAGGPILLQGSHLIDAARGSAGHPASAG